MGGASPGSLPHSPKRRQSKGPNHAPFALGHTLEAARLRVDACPADAGDRHSGRDADRAPDLPRAIGPGNPARLYSSDRERHYAAADLVYVTNASSTSVSVIDTATNRVVTNIPVRNAPFGVAVHPVGSFVYVVNYGSDDMSVINTTTNTVVSTIPVGTGPSGVAVHPNGTFVYVSNTISSSISVINTATHAVITTVPVGLWPRGIAAHPEGTFVYVANQHNNNVSVIETSTHTVVDTVPVGTLPIAFGRFVGPILQ